ncbi:MAG: hypothetical protein ACNS60_00540 [Candidatus Cyclobacteriaceae bacterium M2_1C_046]
MRKIFLIIFLITLVQHGYSQPYKTSLGLRAGVAPGFTIKSFVTPNEAVEGILSTRINGVNLTALYEWHGPLGEVPNFFWYFGGGAHVGIWNGEVFIDDPRDGGYVGLGIDGILGMEYTFEEIPLNLSLDWKPYFNFFEHSYFVGDELALSARYIISGHKGGTRRRY